MAGQTILNPAERAFLAAARQGVLATLGSSGPPHLVPICFVVSDKHDRAGRPLLYTPIDDKPKASLDPHRLGRVRDLLILPSTTVLVARWDEDWARLGWLRVDGRGEILEPQPHEREEHTRAVAALRTKYPQYATHRLDERPIIRIAIHVTRSWGNLSA